MAYNSTYFKMRGDETAKKAVRKVGRVYGKEAAEALEKSLDIEAIKRDYERIFKETKKIRPDFEPDEVEKHATDEVLHNILRGSYQTVEGKKNLRDEEERQVRRNVLGHIVKEAPNEGVKERAKNALDYLNWDGIVDLLYHGRIGRMSKRKYLRMGKKLERRERREERGLVKIVRDSIAIVAFIGAIAFIANAGGKPFMITGGAVFEQPLIIGDGLTIGLFLFLLALAIKLISED